MRSADGGVKRDGRSSPDTAASGGNLRTVTAEDMPVGVRAPQQARSRETMAKLLVATEDLLAEVGADAITMNAVAARAEVSVGAVYRRFENKDLLLRAVKDRLVARLHDRLTSRLDGPLADLDTVIQAYTAAVVGWMVESGRLLPEMAELRRRTSAVDHAEGLATLRALLVEAAAPHRGEVRRHDPDAALAFIGRTVTASAMHRALSIGAAPDGMTWEQWRVETAAMAMAYLTTD
ncbi:TetR/AcrR family transcriptional regulator [Actinomycetospora endophytica]|uniref:TetR/AcrR family transcriptional regulator n=1 Tax=Actinomycetospora endophytica TaxID=2291215 RepID=A0ABS8PC90_9PSEU|nr:TetR/AcrR family transcriptional regulator [Actinomycetospora endophytica]MCD2195843.1 TetR/AcrR family transcriptional regulator [Actinomycetospora endophytica]